MSAAPGSTLWLLRHEMRLAWHGAALNKNRTRRPGGATIAIWVVGWVALHLVAFMLMRELDRDGMDAAHLAIPLTVMVVTCATFMLSSALRSAVRISSKIARSSVKTSRMRWTLPSSLR